MAAQQSQKLQTQSLGALMASLNLAMKSKQAAKKRMPFLDQVLAAFKTLSPEEKEQFQNNTSWLGSKSAETAASRRWHANKMLSKPRKNQDPRAVLLLLSQSICALPYPSEEEGISGKELAAAFAMRAEFFLSTHEYASCIADLNRALDVFPQAPESMKEQWAATKAVAVSRKALKDRIIHNLDAEGHMMSMMARDPTLLPPKLSFPEHETLVGAANCLEVRPDPKNVTRLVATADIRIGDVILVEKAFASVLTAECYISHCYHCMSQRSDLLPCKTCSMVMYCCEVCREADNKVFHQWECRLLGTLVKNFGTAMSWLPALALRLFLVAVYTNRGLDSLLEFAEFLHTQDLETSRGFNSEGQYELPCDFPTVHYSTRGPSVDTELPHIASILLLGLDNLTSFFEQYPADVEKKMRAGALLLRYAVVARDLMFFVDNVSPPKNGQWRSFAMAAAHYPIAALSRRSCSANTISAFRGDTLVLMATENIASGEEVTTSFGISYLTHDLASRQATYAFFPGECRCRACVEQWPTAKELSQLQPTYLCLNCKATLPFELNNTETDVTLACPQCRSSNNILTNKIEEQEVKRCLNSIRKSIQANNSPGVFMDPLILALQRLSSFLRPPDFQLVAVLDLLHNSLRHGGRGNKPRPADTPSSEPCSANGPSTKSHPASAAIKKPNPADAPSNKSHQGEGSNKPRPAGAPTKKSPADDAPSSKPHPAKADGRKPRPVKNKHSKSVSK